MLECGRAAPGRATRPRRREEVVRAGIVMEVLTMRDQRFLTQHEDAARFDAGQRRLAESVLREAGFLPRSGRGRCALPMTFGEVMLMLDPESQSLPLPDPHV